LKNIENPKFEIYAKPQTLMPITSTNKILPVGNTNNQLQFFLECKMKKSEFLWEMAGLL